MKPIRRVRHDNTNKTAAADPTNRMVKRIVAAVSKLDDGNKILFAARLDLCAKLIRDQAVIHFEPLQQLTRN